MDNLAKRLREDAQQIESTISPELDERIRASMHGMTPERPAKSKLSSHSMSLWFASSLTGVAAAIAIIAIVNLQGPEPGPANTSTTPLPLYLPAIEWNAKAAVLTSPLEQEIDDLQSDLKKAEEAVKQDIDRLF